MTFFGVFLGRKLTFKYLPEFLYLWEQEEAVLFSLKLCFCRYTHLSSKTHISEIYDARYLLYRSNRCTRESDLLKDSYR